jgi:hypothetical protein
MKVMRAQLNIHIRMLFLARVEKSVLFKVSGVRSVFVHTSSSSSTSVAGAACLPVDGGHDEVCLVLAVCLRAAADRSDEVSLGLPTARAELPGDVACVAHDQQFLEIVRLTTFVKYLFKKRAKAKNCCEKNCSEEFKSPPSWL